MSLEIQKMLVLSCGHVQEETMLDLGANAYQNVSSMAVEYGALVIVWDRDQHPDSFAASCEEAGEVGPILKLAADNGCQWVLLDRDGPIVDGLESFDW